MSMNTMRTRALCSDSTAFYGLPTDSSLDKNTNTLRARKVEKISKLQPDQWICITVYHINIGKKNHLATFS